MRLKLLEKFWLVFFLSQCFAASAKPVRQTLLRLIGALASSISVLWKKMPCITLNACCYFIFFLISTLPKDISLIWTPYLHAASSGLLQTDGRTGGYLT